MIIFTYVQSVRKMWNVNLKAWTTIWTIFVVPYCNFSGRDGCKKIIFLSLNVSVISLRRLCRAPCTLMILPSTSRFFYVVFFLPSFWIKYLGSYKPLRTVYPAYLIIFHSTTWRNSTYIFIPTVPSVWLFRPHFVQAFLVSLCVMHVL